MQFFFCALSYFTLNDHLVTAATMKQIGRRYFKTSDTKTTQIRNSGGAHQHKTCWSLLYVACLTAQF